MERSPRNEKCSSTSDLSPRLEKTKFSPVKTTSSPVNTGKNLTGVPRLIRDTAANIHSTVQLWNTLHLNGLQLLKAITHIKVDRTYPEELKEPCEGLEKVCNEIDECVENFKLLAIQMTAITGLHKTKEHLFSTWPVAKFANTAETICFAYQKEAAVKRIVCENVAHDHRDAVKMLHLAAWVHQTQILDNITTSLESMLTETRLR